MRIPSAHDGGENRIQLASITTKLWKSCNIFGTYKTARIQAKNVKQMR